MRAILKIAVLLAACGTHTTTGALAPSAQDLPAPDRTSSLPQALTGSALDAASTPLRVVLSAIVEQPWPTPSDASKSAAQWEGIGITLERQGDYPRAAYAYAYAASLTPPNRELIESIARTAREASNDRLSLRALCQLALDTDSDAPGIDDELGLALLRSGQLRAAVERLLPQGALPVGPLGRDHGARLIEIGDALASLGDLEAAIAAYRRSATPIDSAPASALQRIVDAMVTAGDTQGIAQIIADACTSPSSRTTEALTEALNGIEGRIDPKALHALLDAQDDSSPEARSSGSRSMHARLAAAALGDDLGFQLLLDHLEDEPTDSLAQAAAWRIAQGHPARSLTLLRLLTQAPHRWATTLHWFRWSLAPLPQEALRQTLTSDPDLALTIAWLDSGVRGAAPSPEALALTAAVLPLGDQRRITLARQIEGAAPTDPLLLMVYTDLIAVTSEARSLDAVQDQAARALASNNNAIAQPALHATALAHSALQRGRARLAKAQAERAVALSIQGQPADRAQALTALGLANQALAPSLSLDLLNQARSLTPLDISPLEALLPLITPSERLHTPERWSQLLRTLRSEFPNHPTTLTAAALDAHARGDRLGLLTAASRAITEPVPTAEPAHLLISALNESREFAAAAETIALLQTAAVLPTVGDARILTAEQLAAEGKATTAASILTAYLRQAPADARVSLAAEEFHRQSGRTSRAQSTAYQRLQLAPILLGTLIEQATLELATRDPETSTQTVLEALRLADGDASQITAEEFEALQDWVTALTTRNFPRQDDAKAILANIEAVTEQLPSLEPKVAVQIAKVRFAAGGDIDEIFAAAIEAARTDPTQANDLFLSAADAADGLDGRRTGNGPERLTILRRASLEYDPFLPFIASAWLSAALRMQDFDEMMEECRLLTHRATEAGQLEAVILYNAAQSGLVLDTDMLRTDGRITEASTRFAHGIGGELANRGHFKEAFALYEAGLDITPGDPELSNSYGYRLLEEDPSQLERAARLIEDAWEASPNEPHIADSIGWLRYHQGIFNDEVDPETGAVTEGAITLLTKSVDLLAPLKRQVRLPNEVLGVGINLIITLDHLGQAQAQAGDLDAAHKTWERIAKTETVWTIINLRNNAEYIEALQAEISPTIEQLQLRDKARRAGDPIPLTPPHTRATLADPLAPATTPPAVDGEPTS